MTRMLLLSVAVATRLAAQAVSPASVPAPVQRALQARYPGLTGVSWSQTGDKTYVAAFHSSGSAVAASYTPAGQWVESTTEICAIAMPEPVRNAVVREYRGYQFVSTLRLDRATAPIRLYEIHLAKPGERVTVQYEPGGAPFGPRKPARAIDPPKPVPSPVPSEIAGTWRGESICLAGYTPCRDDIVIYRFSAAAADTNGYDVQMSHVVSGEELDTGRLACTLDRKGAALICVSQIGKWEFRVSGDTLTRGLTLASGTQGRRVVVRRQP